MGTRLEGSVYPSVTSSGLVYLGGHYDCGEERLFVFESGNSLRIPIEASLGRLGGGKMDAVNFLGSLTVNQRGISPRSALRPISMPPTRAP